MFRYWLLLAVMFTGGCSSLHKLDYHGVPENKLDIVIVTSRHYGTNPARDPQWSADAWSIKERLVGHPMFAAHRSRINVTAG